LRTGEIINTDSVVNGKARRRFITMKRNHKITQISTRKALFFSFLVISELGLTLILTLTSALAAEATAATPATMSIGNFTSAYYGETVTAPILISNVENYGTGTISVTYDLAVVHVTDIASGPDSTVVDWNTDNTTGIVIIFAVTTEAEQPLIPFLISGHVFYDNGSGCNNPHVNIMNLNTNNKWAAKTSVTYNYYQLVSPGDINRKWAADVVTVVI